MWESDIDAAILQSNYGIAPDDWSEERISAATNYIINHDRDGDRDSVSASASASFQALLPNLDEHVDVAPDSIHNGSQKLEIPTMSDINAMREFISDEEYTRLATLRRIRDLAKRNRDDAIRAEQDVAYQASLAADRLKDIEKEKNAIENKEREAREASEASEAREASERQEFLRAKRCQYFTATRN